MDYLPTLDRRYENPKIVEMKSLKNGALGAHRRPHRLANRACFTKTL